MFIHLLFIVRDSFFFFTIRPCLTLEGLVDQLAPRSLRSNVRPVMDPDSYRNPSVATRRPPDAPSAMVRATPCPPQPDSELDNEKIGAILLFFGVLLVLAGVTFTTLDSTVQWTKLLGPILITVGGTFMLTSVCKFRVGSFLFCRRLDGEALAAEQTSGGHAFTLTGVNQQVTFCGGTAVLNIPPVYNCANQEVCQARELQPARCVNGVHGVLVPPRDSVYCVHNAAFSAEEEGSSAHVAAAGCRAGR